MSIQRKEPEKPQLGNEKQEATFWDRVKKYQRAHPFKFLFLCVFIIFGVIPYAITWIFPPGICYSQMHFYSDEELIDLHGWGPPGRKADVTQNFIRSYRVRHPKCCRVIRGGVPSALVNHHHVLVELTYEMSEEEVKDSKEKYYQANIVADACGNYRRFFGSTTNEIPEGF
jgi:hypothetical protein